jgi:hypothetical protein
MEAVLLILVFLFAIIALGVYATVKAVGAAKRKVDRTLAQARRSVEDTALRARSTGQPGVQGELAQLRLRLRTSMRATQDVLHADSAQDAALAESVRLFERLSAHGHELENHLRQAERDPDRATVAAHLDELRERTERITHAADSLRWAVRDRARKFAEDDLSALSADIDMESGALRHWAPVEGPEQEAGEWAGAGTDRVAGAGSWETPDQQALGPTDRRRFEAPYPWQKQRKAPKPETMN